ncbi:MAG: metallophosphoesterase family protein [Planctomycetota bacterium]
MIQSRRTIGCTTSRRVVFAEVEDLSRRPSDPQRYLTEIRRIHMRVIAIGDVHGCFSQMTDLLELIQPTSDDQLVWLGDYVDRGPDSALVVQALIDRSNLHNDICLRGNHEIMMERALYSLPDRRSWGLSGGGATWDSYETHYGITDLDDVPDSHWGFIRSLKNCYATDAHIFVHASLDSSLPLEEQSDSDLFWGRFSSIGPHFSGKTVVCGHTSQKDGRPKSTAHSICIDTWAYGDGWLTALDTESGRYWQVNGSSFNRSVWIDEL